MALSKSIALSNGITVDYHRVVSVTNVTNVQLTVEVGSYTSEDMRLAEKASALSRDAGGADPYISTSWFVVDPYREGMDVSEAYAYIKTLPEFEGATDVMEVGQGAAE